MSFLQDAQISAICILASSVRAVLCEASAQALQQRIKCRLDKNETDATSPVEITAQDVDAAYQTANRVAERWVIELKKVGEVDAASVVEKVRLSGNFLEDGFVDDVALDDMDEMELTGEGEDPMDSIVSNLNASFQPTSTPMSIDQKDCGEKINMKELIDDRELPKEFSMVSKNFGCRDPCQVELDVTLQPSSTQWYPLPEESDDLNSSRPVHIPEPTNLPPSQIQSLPPNQLYGAPSPSLALDHHNPFGYLLGKNGSLHEQFLKQQIKILDELGSMNQTLWIGEWDVMERATDLVRKRNHLLPSKRKIQNKKDDFFFSNHTIVSKSQKVDTESKEGGNEDDSMANVTQLFPKRKRDFLKAKERRETSLRQLQDGRGNGSSAPSMDELGTEQAGRKASILGSARWSIEDIRRDLSESVKNELVERMIHPNRDVNQRNEFESNQVIGALKLLGSIHLWEQVRTNNWRGQLDSMSDEETSFEIGSEAHKIRKRAHRRARRQRLVPNIEIKGDEKGDLSKLSSKVVWTENAEKGHHPKVSAELDLGECMMTVVVTSRNGQAKRKLVAFRSLEVSLTED